MQYGYPSTCSQVPICVELIRSPARHHTSHMCQKLKRKNNTISIKTDTKVWRMCKTKCIIYRLKSTYQN